MNQQAYKRSVTLLAAASLVTLAFLGGKGWAAGVPTTGALTYSGNLESAGGTPLTGNHSIQVSFWNTASGGTSPLCQTVPSSLSLDPGGRFTLTLPDECATAVRNSANVWVQVTADGLSMERSKLGAVPYALEAAAAAQGAVQLKAPATTPIPARVCSGTTDPNGTAWSAQDAKTLWTAVDFSACGFTSPPVLTTSLGATGAFTETTGGAQPQDITAKGFKIYLAAPKAIDPSTAAALKWHVNWIAVGN